MSTDLKQFDAIVAAFNAINEDKNQEEYAKPKSQQRRHSRYCSTHDQIHHPDREYKGCVFPNKRVSEDRGRFPVGHVPFNKGKPHPYGKETEFKAGPGHTGDKHPTWGGGVQKMAKDCVYVWDGTNKRLRRPAKIWIEHNGPIPKGMCIIHRDGDKHNDDISNLALITRADLMRMNSRG